MDGVFHRVEYAFHLFQREGAQCPSGTFTLKQREQTYCYAQDTNCRAFHSTTSIYCLLHS
jgi:hypothetical protein